MLRTTVLILTLLTSLALSQNSPTQPGSDTGGVFSGHLKGVGMDGATITLVNSTTGASQTVNTDNSGAFSFSNLMPGTYQVTVKSASGLMLRQNSIEITQSSSNQIQLNPGTTTPAGNITLAGTSSTLELDSAEVSRSYDSQVIRTLPLLDRQNQELITLMPGITPPTSTFDRINDPQRIRSFNVNGLPSYANLFNIDGAYNNEPFNGRALRPLSNESVQALEVRSSNYNAEYGTTAGSWSSTVTRPGTNAVHGSLFGFNTNNFFQSGRSVQQAQSNDRFNVNQFGASAGGALLPNRLFWFLSYEGLIQRGRQTELATVPLRSFSNGNFSQVPGIVLFNPLTGSTAGTGRSPFLGNNIPQSQINSSSQQILAGLPAPNLPGLSNNLVGGVRLLDDTHRIDGKTDYRITEKSTGFLRYGFTESSVDKGSLLGPVGSPLNAGLRTMNAVGSHTQIFTTNLMGEFRMGYSRYRNQVTPWQDSEAAVPLRLTGFPNGLPSINISGFSPFGFAGNVPRKEISNVYDGASTWLYHTGMHSLKFGVNIRALEANGFNPNDSPFGSFTFGPAATLGSTASAGALSQASLQANALAAFLIGAPTQGTISSYTSTPAYRQMQYSAYITDTINLYRHLYLELGVRYDIFSPVESARAGGLVAFDPSSNTIAALGISGFTSRPTRTDTNNVSPRIGLAFRPITRLVFRAGYGIHYFPTPFALLPINPAIQGTQVGGSGGLGVTQFETPSVSSTFTGAPNLPFSVGPRTVPTPYIQSYSAMMQADLGNGFSLDAGYVGNAGRQLPFNFTQTGLPGSGLNSQGFGRTALLTRFGSGLNSNYNSGQFNLTKKFAAGLAFSGAYTYSKALDYGSTLLDPFTPRQNYGPADWDRKHILSLSHNWRLPFGAGSSYFKSGPASQVFGSWELNGILRWATGSPYTITFDPLSCACIGATALPAAFNQNGGSSLDGASFFNPSQFSAPAAGTFGTLRRNGFRGPELFVYNLALYRNFPIRENIKLEFRGEAYNLTNTSNLGNPVSNSGTPGFGSSTSTLNNDAGRQFQVGVRILY